MTRSRRATGLLIAAAALGAWVVARTPAARAGDAAAGPAPSAQARPPADAAKLVAPAGGHFTRVRVHILGIFSPRGIFNLVVRLYKLDGLERYKFDMPDALMILDFKPGVKVDPTAVRNVMVRAGYQPGPFTIDELPVSAFSPNEPGWLRPPKIEAKSALMRWFELNF